MKELAAIAYEAYRNHTGGKSLATGQNIPEWPDLAPVIQEAWRAAANAVANAAADDIMADLPR